jgi:UDP-N-acetylmuramoylalanine--D-glutamate ligase
VTEDSLVVLELSNFQLIDFKGRPQIAVCLMLVPEHQDWHKSIDEYYKAKSQLFVRQTRGDLTVYNANNEISVKMTAPSHGTKLPYAVPGESQVVFEKEGVYVEGEEIYFKDKPICKISDVALLGRHNLENVCAAIAATWDIVGGNKNSEVIKKVVSSFTGLEHRLEFVRELDGVKYYNDSFATTPEATVAAIKAFKEPKVIILGGHDKGIPFYELVDAVIHKNVRQAVVIGDTGEKIIELLVARGFENISLGGDTMTEIVQTAKESAQPGDVVLLSTACASFGLFENYKDRGDQFKAIVNSLK